MMTKITQNKVLSFSLDITILWLFKSKKSEIYLSRNPSTNLTVKFLSSKSKNS